MLHFYVEVYKFVMLNIASWTLNDHLCQYCQVVLTCSIDFNLLTYALPMSDVTRTMSDHRLMLNRASVNKLW